MADTVFNDVMILLGASVVAAALFRRLNLPPVLAYLAVGFLVGPHLAGLIGRPEELAFLSEFGLVFLLFSLGLEFSVPRMRALKTTVFGLGACQVIVCSGLFWALGYALGLSPVAALVTAGALGLSSTAIVTRELARWNELDSPHGHAAVGVLLFQDLAALLFLILIPAMAGDGSHLLSELGIMLAKGIGLVIVMLAIGKWILPLVFQEISRSRSEELFVLTALLVALFSAWLTHSLHLSMALGAFLAGMMLGESHFRHQIEADIRPFRDILLGLFFVSVGMLLDPQVLLAQWDWVVIGVACLLAAKALLITGLAKLSGRPLDSSLRTGLVLAQGGEFGFALLALASQQQLMETDTIGLVVAIIIGSLVVTPSLIRHNHYLTQRLCRSRTPTQENPHTTAELSAATAPMSGHVIVCGFGRVGQTVGRFLTQEKIEWIAIDTDPIRVHEAASAGEPVVFGDAQRQDILRALGIERARQVVITVNQLSHALAILHAIQPLELEKLKVLVRTQDDADLETYKAAGATEVIPEVLEGSLMLVSHVLVNLEVPFRRVARSIQSAREARYSMLHGYFHGQQSQLIDKRGNPLLRRHPLTLTANAWACERRLDEIILPEHCGILIARVVRANGECIEDPTGALLLACGDTLVLSGLADHIEEAEARLLSG
ncbi:cation:proton antiporter [Cobetia sp. QF-1]|uniref:cation:proton antiporter domain-containing protein n=1 Tax=Cobetia sp. QF-1 TaxID=1969833 RepID=UPI000B53AE9F|nr:cation:proton antiporter [Cobetia sp. QF-1]